MSSTKKTTKKQVNPKKSSKSKKVVPGCVQASNQLQCCCCCCCCCAGGAACCVSQITTNPKTQVKSNRYELNPIYLNAPSNGYQLIQIITDRQSKSDRSEKAAMETKRKFKNSTKISSALVNSQKITTRSKTRSFLNPTDNIPCSVDENQSYIHDTLLNDFNQYGQLRIWYVWPKSSDTTRISCIFCVFFGWIYFYDIVNTKGNYLLATVK